MGDDDVLLLSEEGFVIKCELTGTATERTSYFKCIMF